MNETLWDYIKSLYMRHFKIPPRVVDYMAMEPVLTYCAEGKSNYSISMKFDIPLDYVEEILKEFIQFGGWILDLDISPLMLYNSYDGDYEYYKSTIKTVSSLTTKDEINTSFAICRKLTKIRKEIREYVK